MLSCFRRRRRRCGTSNTQGLGELGLSRHRLSFADIPLRISPDVLLARSRRLGQPPRCVLDVIVVPAAATVERGRRQAPQAPTPLEPFSVLFQRPQKCEIDVKCAELLTTYGRWRICATSSAERCLASESWDFVTPSKTEKSANRRQMDRGPRLKFSLMLATVGGGEGAARSATYNSVSALPRGHGPPTLLSLVISMLSVSQANPSASMQCSAASRLYPLPSSLSTLAAQRRSSPTIYIDFYATSPPLKQRIDVPRARISPTSRFRRPSRRPSPPGAPFPPP
ncbi:hypothetical protein GGG16DRAFT_119867 [Schizophyllum commune]